ncbi:MAG TPA: hypothetical protein VF680_17250 [Allosphingosinicella sp.]|jgi:hypothetical protein
MDKEIINKLAETNDYTYNLLKAAEELNELSLVLIQLVNKPNKVNLKEVTDEIGDVKIRLKVLEELFSKDDVKARVTYKLGKFAEYFKSGKYKGQI